MQNLVNTYLEKFKQEHHVRRRLTCLLLALAMVVSTGVYWQLHLTGAALTNEVYCGMEEHTHTPTSATRRCWSALRRNPRATPTRRIATRR